jgi:hypothetical protein
MSRELRVTSVHALYRADKKDGFDSRVVLAQEGEDLTSLMENFEKYYQAFLAWPGAERRSFLDRAAVAQILAAKNTEDAQREFMAMGNIYLLEREGVLQPDEYNGFMVGVLYSDGKLVTARTLEDYHRLRREGGQ